MAPPGQRSSPVAVSKAAKKVKKGDDIETKCEEICAALHLAEKKGIPPSVTEFLIAALPHALPLYKEHRHEFQHDVLKMVAKTLEKSQEALETEVSGAEAVVNGGDEERSRRDTAVFIEEQRLAERQEELKEKQAAKAKVLETARAAVESVKEAWAKLEQTDLKISKVELEEQSVKAMIVDLLTPLKEGHGGKRQLYALTKQLSSANLEDSLVQAIQLPLGKNPDARGSFDAVILVQLDLQLADKTSCLETGLEEEYQKREVQAAAVLAAEEAVEATEASSGMVTKELKVAREAEIAAKASLNEAEEASKHLTTELLAAAQQLDNSRHYLFLLQSGPLATFQELVDRSFEAEAAKSLPLKVVEPEPVVPAWPSAKEAAEPDQDREPELVAQAASV
eukprot:TRINITY_DN98662_c0_g1_i1.p1 TRINITY_DN98662_c0_g1~~TRINITY_DN98662_c0_g1_i1.p1  ORF type:complete len:395 (+),score=115.03 TRINITY_DN98662_c0_g1_i1:73-1257(+)